MNETNSTTTADVPSVLLENQQIVSPSDNVVTIQTINDNLIKLNNSVVSIGTSIIFILSIVVGVVVVKVFKIWN